MQDKHIAYTVYDLLLSSIQYEVWLLERITISDGSFAIYIRQVGYKFLFKR